MTAAGLSSRPMSRSISALIASGAIAVAILLGTAPSARACSCVGPQPMAAYAGDPSQIVFTGFVQAPDGRGVPVQVTHWFQGDGAGRIVWLSQDGFGGDGASCGTQLPPRGSEWIFVAWRADAGSDLSVNLCTPHAPASDATGQAMYADAVATFGEGIVPGGDSAGGAGAEPTGSSSEGDGPFTALTLAMVGLAGIFLVGAILVVIRRGRDSGGDSGG